MSVVKGFKYGVGFTAGTCAVAGTVYLGKALLNLSFDGFDYLREKWFAKKNNIILIDETITHNLFIRFMKDFDALDTNENDINIVLTTSGGGISATAAICKYIISKRNKNRKINCYIVKNAYSSGVRIALACDTIYAVGNNVTFSPTDIMLNAVCDGKTVSLHDISSSIVDRVEQKEKLTDSFTLLSHEIKKYQKDDNDLFKLLMSNSDYSDEKQKLIHHNFFSGNMDHDKYIFLNEAKEMGLCFEIIEKLPQTFIHSKL